MTEFVDRHRLLLGLIGGLVALGLAVVWTMVVPGRAETATGLREAILRYAHPACWALLSAAGFVWAFGGPSRVAGGLAQAALATYVAFILAMVI